MEGFVGINRMYQGLESLPLKYNSYLSTIDECARSGADINRFDTEIERTAFSVLLENATRQAVDARRIVDESGFSGVGAVGTLSTMNTIKNIETTLLDLFTGTAVRMLSYRVVSVQPIQTPQAYVYYFDFKYAKDKGEIKAGTSFIKQLSSKTLGYAGSTIFNEKLVNGSELVNGHSLVYGPIKPGTVVLLNEDGTKKATDNGQGAFVGTLVHGSASANKINYTTGEIKLQVEDGSSSVAISANYEYDTEIAEPNPIQAELVAVPVTAEVKTLKSTASLVAVLNSKAVLGVDLTTTALEVATRELAAEFDYDIFRDLYEGAPVSLTVEKLDNSKEDYETFMGRFEQSISEASNGIFNATQKLEASFIICGTYFASVLEQSKKFRPADNRGEFASGPRIAGEYNNLLVIKVPNNIYGVDDAIIGAKSDIPVLGAGYVFAPYIMAFPSQLFSDPNLRVSQGFISMAAKAMVNPDLYVKLSLV